MAFNLGAFASGLAKGGISTYVTLQELEERKKEREMREQEFAFKQREQDQIAAMDKAIQETRGAVGKPTSFVGGEMGPVTQEQAQEQTAALDLNKAPTLYTQEQADKDMYQRLAGQGIKGTQTATALKQTALQTKQMERTAKYEQLLDDYSDKLVTMQNTIEQLPNVGMDKVPDLVNKDLKAYGVSARYKPIASEETGGIIELLDKQGKVINIFNDVQSVQAAIQGQEDALHKNMASQLVTMLPSASDRIKFLQDSQRLTMEKTRVGFEGKRVELEGKRVGIDEKNLGLKEKELEEKLRVDLFGSEAAKNRSSAESSRMHGQYYGALLKVAKETAAGREAMQPSLDAFEALPADKQDGPEGQRLLIAAAAAGAKKSGDVAAIVSALKKPDKSNADMTAWQDIEKELYKREATPAAISQARVSFFAERGYAPPAATNVIMSGKDPKTGKPLSASDVEAFNRQFPNSAVKPESLPWLGQGTSSAIPVGASAGAPAAASTAPAASAIPTEAPTPQSKTLYGKTKYTLPGVIGAYDTAEEAQAAWVRTNQPKPGRQY